MVKIEYQNVELNQFYQFFKPILEEYYTLLKEDYEVKGRSDYEKCISVYFAVYIYVWLLYLDYINKLIDYQTLKIKIENIRINLNKKRLKSTLTENPFQIVENTEIGIGYMKIFEQPVFTIGGTEFTNDFYEVAYSYLIDKFSILTKQDNCVLTLLKSQSVDDLTTETRILTKEDIPLIFNNSLVKA